MVKNNYLHVISHGTVKYLQPFIYVYKKAKIQIGKPSTENFYSDIGGCGLVTKSCPPFATPWPAAHQAPLFIGLPRQEYWSGLPFPSPGDLPDPGIEPTSPALQAVSSTQADSL